MSIVKVAGTEYRVITGHREVFDKEKGISYDHFFQNYRRARPKPESKRDLHRKIVAINKLPKRLQPMFFAALEKQYTKALAAQ